MTPEEKQQIQQTLAHINKSLSQTLSKARKSSSEYDHHLIQNSSADPFTRITYLLSQAYAIAEHSELPPHKYVKILEQLESIQHHFTSKLPSDTSNGELVNIHK